MAKITKGVPSRTGPARPEPLYKRLFRRWGWKEFGPGPKQPPVPAQDPRKEGSR